MEPGLATGWRFDGGSGTTDTDYSGNGPPPVTQYLHQDHLGTISLQTTQNGAFAGASFHAPFGDRWHEGGPSPAPPTPARVPRRARTTATRGSVR